MYNSAIRHRLRLGVYSPSKLTCQVQGLGFLQQQQYTIINSSKPYQRPREYRDPIRSTSLSATTTQSPLCIFGRLADPKITVERLRMPASDLVTSEHLAVHNLDNQSIRVALEQFGQWAEGLKFQPTTIPGVQRCEDPDRDKKVRPLLKELGYENRVDIKYQILRITSKSNIAGSHACLIPVHVRDGESPTIHDSTTGPSKLDIGQKIYFDRAIIIGPGMDCLIIAAR